MLQEGGKFSLDREGIKTYLYWTKSLQMGNSNSGKKHTYPGILVKCESGRFLAYFEHRTDITASGENEKDAKKNLKRMYKAVMEFEAEQEKESGPSHLPPNVETKRFLEKV